MSESQFGLHGKVAVITGAAEGLGRAIAVGLARAGADVALGDINTEGLKETIELARSFGVRGVSSHCDIGEPESVRSFFELVDAELDHVDILVNNAGIIIRRHPEEIEIAEWERVFRVNATGTFLCSQQAGRRMISRGAGGSIINISSTTSLSGMGRGNFAYSASKSAINQITRDLAVEWAQYGIRVNAVVPAQVRTAYLQRLIDNPGLNSDALVATLLDGIPLHRLGEVEDVVGPVVFLASEAARFVTGILLPVDGGNLAFNAAGSKTW
jgi:NAD(P)-dependent dehydrogenase (short-subunit alcohol dehydrogenase family)